MTATAVKAPILETAPIPFTLLNTGRAASRSRAWLKDQWQRTVVTRLTKECLLEPDKADPVFEDIMKIHGSTRELLGGDSRTWELPKEILLSASDLLLNLGVVKDSMPTPKFLIMILEHLQTGNPTPALNPIITELKEKYGPTPADDPNEPAEIPSFVLNNKLGRASFTTYIENNPATITIPTTPEEMIRSVYLALLYRFLTESIGNMRKIGQTIASYFDTLPHLKMRLTIEPHAFLCLGHMPGVDVEACFGAGGSNSRYAVLLAAQPNSVVCHLGYNRDNTKKFIPVARAWGRLHDTGIMLSNFYPKQTHGHLLGQAILLTACFPKGDFPTGPSLAHALYNQREASNKAGSVDTCLWTMKGYPTCPLYHNGDAIWYPLAPKLKSPPVLAGRIPKLYADIPWLHPFGFPTYTE